jgi:UPF0755 protein
VRLAIRLIAGLTLLVLLAGGSVLFMRAFRSLDEPVRLNSALLFTVQPKSSFAHVANELAAHGVIAEPRAWVWYARYKGLASAVKAGEYQIEPGITPRELLSKMVSGQVLLHAFTIVDGWRVADLLEALRHHPEVKASLPQAPLAMLGPKIMEQLGSAGVDIEGQFLPETYKFISGTPDIEILRQAHAALQHELNSAWMGRALDIPLHNTDELLIMASIVQKESGVPQELAKIAGLYLHRLSIGMRLQADPTVIYGMGERYEGDIHSVDLRADGPYNSYTRAGLPPTPIALAGAAVIRATAHPQKTDALYFVASPKADGTHVFSATLEEHNAAVAAYVAHLRQKPSAPAAR